MAGSRNPSPSTAGREEDDIEKIQTAGYVLNQSDSGLSVQQQQQQQQKKKLDVRLASRDGNRDGDGDYDLERVMSQEVENAAAGSVIEGEVTGYRVYKRRWFGLLQLTLLNIIVSWDVSQYLLPTWSPLSPVHFFYLSIYSFITRGVLL